jgi:hypothetical protein
MVAAARDFTRELRDSAKPRWRALRDCLGSEGVDPSDAAVGFLYPDDVKLEMGLIKVRDGRLFEFALEWWYDEQGNELASSEDAWVSEWRNVDQAKMTEMDKEIQLIAETVLATEGE